MSFFNDFLNELNIGEIKNYLSFSIIINKGFYISGNFKVEFLSNEKIIVSSNKNKIEISGEKLDVVFLSKGEICLSGEIKCFQVKDEKSKC